MLRVPITQAKEGMTLAMSVQHPDRADTVLLRDGVRLTDTLIDRLRQIRCRDIWISFPALDEIREYVRPEIQEQHAVVTAQISAAFSEVLDNWRPKLDYTRYRDAVQGLLDNLLEHPTAGIFAMEIVSAKRPVLRHASNVCMLSMLIGMGLDFYLMQERSRLPTHRARDVSSLGVGAMLHDLGMLRLDDEVVQRWQKTADDTDPEFQEHVNLGYRLVRGSVDASAAAVVLHHHQQYDGSGFPGGRDARGETHALCGSDIHVFARIVAAADLFDRLRYQRDTLVEPVPVVRVLSMLARPPYVSTIDPLVRIGLMNVVPPFPPGSIVTLSSGDQAVVVGWTPLEPCRPRVRILTSFDPDEMSDAPPIDLRAQRDLSIACAEGQDVSGDLFNPATPKEFDLSAVAIRPTGESDQSVKRSA